MSSHIGITLSVVPKILWKYDPKLFLISKKLTIIDKIAITSQQSDAFRVTQHPLWVIQAYPIHETTR